MRNALIRKGKEILKRATNQILTRGRRGMNSGSPERARNRAY